MSRAPETRTTPTAPRALVAGAALGIAGGWSIGNVGAVASTVATAYAVPLAAIGLLTSALFAGHLAAQLPAGTASDRYGARAAGAAALAAIAAGSTVALAADLLALGLVGRAVTGLGTGLAFVAGNAYIRDAGGGPLAQGVYGGLGVLAGGVALFAVPRLTDPLGWRAPYWTALAISAAAAGTLAAAPALRPAIAVTRGSIASVVSDRRLYRLAAIYAASFGLVVVSGSWIVELLTRQAALGVAAASAIGSLSLFLGVVSRPLGGWVMARFPAAIRAIVAGSLAASGIATALLALGAGSWLAAVACTVLGVGAGIAFAPVMTAAAALRPDAPAASVGLVNSAAIAAILVGTPLVGLTFALPGDGRVGFAVLAALWGLVLLAMPDRATFRSPCSHRRPSAARRGSGRPPGWRGM